jgi:uncharacterized protein
MPPPRPGLPFMIIYLHGFKSSSRSQKAVELKEFLDREGYGHGFWCEDLPVSPLEAIMKVEDVIATSKTRPLLVGSSLGGYYATYLAEKYDLDAVLVNPACHAARLLEPWLGPHENIYTGSTFTLEARHIRELESLDMPSLSKPSRFWVLLETGDEVLDYRDAVNTYRGARFSIVEGGDHSLQSFPVYLPEILALGNRQPI